MVNQKIVDYIEQIDQPWQVEVCTKLREVVGGVPGVDEEYKWNSPFYLLGGRQFASYSAFKRHVRLNVFNARGLEAPDGFFEADGNDERRALLIHEGDDVDYELLGRLLRTLAETVEP